MTWWSPSLEYSLTRTFKWPWFGGISLLGAVGVVLLLATINIPLTGYETVLTFQNNFNATDFHWFYRVMPFRLPKPGSLCDPHIFKVGDPFTTNYTYFEWNIDSVVKANAGDSAISYKGIPLTFCDVTAIHLTGELPSWNIDFTVIVTCKQDDMFKMTAKTSFSVSFLPGRYSGIVKLFNDNIDDTRDLYHIIRFSSIDIAVRGYNAFVGSNHTTPTIVSLRANCTFCPMSLGIAAPCSNSPPKFVIPDAAAVYANATIHRFLNNDSMGPVDHPYILDAEIEQPTYNLLQAVYAAVRVDLGNPSPNNFILNPSALNATIVEKFPVTAYNQDQNSTTSGLYSQLRNPDAGFQKYLPLNVSGPAHIQVAYPCRFQQPKPLGSLIVSVLVATLSMFSGAWAVFIFTATAFAKRTDPAANRCDGHCSRHRTSITASWFDSYNPYALQPTGSSGHSPSTTDYMYTPLST